MAEGEPGFVHPAMHLLSRRHFFRAPAGFRQLLAAIFRLIRRGDTHAAMKAGLFQVVREEDKDAHFPNYAAQNDLEYFTELTAMYFTGANCFPKDRAGLKACDLAGHALIEKLWGVHAPPPASARAGENK